MRFIIYAVVGVVLLGGGFYTLSAGSSVADADRERCEQIVRNIYGDNDEAANILVARCNEPGTVAMMDARAQDMGAAQAAEAVGSANRGGLFGDLIGYALIGAGIGAFGAAFVPLIRARRSKKA